MKLLLLVFIFLSILFCNCQQTIKDSSYTKQDTTKSITIDSSFRDTALKYIQFVSDEESSHFKTPIEARFFRNDICLDSIIEGAFDMHSWYSKFKDTIYLVAHISGTLETEALLIRFLHGNTTVYFYRAPHLAGRDYFKNKKDDVPVNELKVPPVRYDLKLSEIPDTINKQVVFGYIDLESDHYYDIRDSADHRHKVQMKYYFRSQFRKLKN